MSDTNATNSIQNFLSSPGFYGGVKKIADQFNLHVDQFGELYAEINDVIREVSSSSDFIEHISKRLEIEKDLAAHIATEVNKEVFSAVKTNLKLQTSTDDVENIGRAGGFRVEKEAPEQGNGVTPADRGKILAGLENPPPSVPSSGTALPPQNLPTDSRATSMPSAPRQEENHTEPLVDYLLSNPASKTVEKVVSTPQPAAQSKPLQPSTPSKPVIDPYKEQI